MSGSNDKTLKLWDVSTGKCLHTFRGHSKSVQSVGFSNNGRYALSGSGDKTIKLWKLSTGKCLYTFEGHTHYVESVAFSPDGRYIFSGSEDHTLKLWELDWEYEFPGWADWDDGARPYVKNFLTLRKDKWSDDDFQELLKELSRRGFGWLRPEGVRGNIKNIEIKRE